MRLYLIHCGFYDKDVGCGIFESHTNFFIVAKDANHAKKKVKENKTFQTKKMHIDGLQEIHAVDGYRISLEYDESLNDDGKIQNLHYRDLAPKKS